VRATLDATGIADAYCSCPVGSGGTCKHVAALLLTWLAQPDAFTALQETGEALEARSKAELIALIKQMLRQEPDLEMLLETPLPGAKARREPVNPEIYRRQAAAVFRGAAYEYGAEADISFRLEAITEIGEGFAEQGQYADAAAVYAAVSAEVMENYESFGDEGGELGDVVGLCIEGLGDCRIHEQDDATRETILRALFEIYQFDVGMGGVGLGDGVPDLILEVATPGERAAVAGWVRAALPTGHGWSADYRRQEYGGFLLDLEAYTLDDEGYLRLCRETGRTGDLIVRLLALDRVEEAAREAADAQDNTLLELADIFVEHGQGEVAECLLEARAAATTDYRLVEWLKKRARAAGRGESALHWAMRLFRLQPTLAHYQEVRELARAHGNWESLRPELISVLQDPQYLYYLIQVYLDEGDIDAAIAALPAPAVQHIGVYNLAAPHLQVARAAEETRPAAARTIYQQYLERLIEWQGRDNYQQAARLLVKVRALFQSLGEDAAWTQYIAELRQRYNRYRALKEELARVGL
jgi:uncharacterized Zn finger protein